MIKKQHPDSLTYMNEDEDINLKYLFGLFSKGLNRLKRKINELNVLVFKYKFLILFIASLGALLGFGAYKITKPFYTSSMTLVLSDIRNEFVEDQLNKLVLSIEDDNFDAIADMLDVRVEAARQLKAMNFSNLDADRIDQDSILMGSPFKIELALYDNTLFSSLEPALASYLESNRYFSKLKRIRQREVESIIQKLKSDISSLDSVKTSVISPRGPVNGFVYGEPIDPTNLYRESITMYQQQVSLEAELDQLDNIQIVNGFTARSKPTGPKLTWYLLTGAALFFFIGLLVASKLDSKRSV